MRRQTTSAKLTCRLALTSPMLTRLRVPQSWEGPSSRIWAIGKRRCAYLYLQGWQDQAAGNLQSALRAFQEILIRGRQAGHQGWITAAESAIADLTSAWPVPATASDLTQEFKLAAACRQAARLYTRGDAAAALTTYRQTLMAATQAEQPLAIATCLNGLGLIELDQQRYESAESHLRAAVWVLADRAAPELCAIAHHNLGLVYYQQGRYPQAQTCFQAALQHWQETPDSLGVALTLDYLGRVYAQQQDCWLALGSFEAAIDVLNDLAEQIDVRYEAAALLMQIAALCEQTQHPQLAIAYWLEALEIYETLPDMAPRLLIWQRLSQLHQQAGQTAIARHYRQRVCRAA